MTNITIAINGSLLRADVSGVELSITNLARALADHGTETYVLHVPPTCPGPDIESARFRTVHTRWPTHKRPVRILWEHLALPRLVRRTADVFHAPGYVAPRTPGVPSIITVYDLIALDLPRLCRRTNVAYYRLFLPAAVRRAAAIIVPSAATRRDLAAHFPSAEPKTHVIPLGIHDAFLADRDDPATAAVLHRRRIPAPFILCTARHEPKKNLVLLVEAYAQLKRGAGLPHALVLAGPDGWASADVRAAIRRSGLGEHVHLPGFIPLKDLVHLCRGADLFVFPSLYEGFGLPPLEAMACGTPVITSNRGALPEIVGNAAVQADPTDPAAVAACMRRVLTSPDLRRALGEAGVQRARGFTWRAAAAATDQLYRSVYAATRGEHT